MSRVRSQRHNAAVVESAQTMQAVEQILLSYLVLYVAMKLVGPLELARPVQRSLYFLRRNSAARVGRLVSK